MLIPFNGDSLLIIRAHLCAIKECSTLGHYSFGLQVASCINRLVERGVRVALPLSIRRKGGVDTFKRGFYSPFLIYVKEIE